VRSPEPNLPPHASSSVNRPAAPPAGDGMGWPDALIHLGEQLRADAAHLAERYPADPKRLAAVSLAISLARGARSAPPTSRRAVGRHGPAIRAALLVGCLCGAGWSCYRSLAPHGLPFQGDFQPGGPAGAGEQAGSQPDSSTARLATSAHPPLAAPSDTTPAEILFLQNVSGPELEGVLDLLEHEHAEAPRFRLSI
jgi:hypothetical protein